MDVKLVPCTLSIKKCLWAYWQKIRKKQSGVRANTLPNKCSQALYQLKYLAGAARWLPLLCKLAEPVDLCDKIDIIKLDQSPLTSKDIQ